MIRAMLIPHFLAFVVSQSGMYSLSTLWSIIENERKEIK